MRKGEQKMTRFGSLVVAFALLAAFVSPAGAQLASPADVPSRLVGAWTVMFQGGKPRTLNVSTATPKSGDVFAITGTYNFSGDREAPFTDGEAVQLPDGIQIKFNSASGAAMTATLKSDGSFTGISKYQGKDFPMVIAKGAVAASAGPAPDRAFADEDKDWGIAPSSTPQGPPHGKPTPMSIPGAKVIKTLALKSFLDANKQVVVVDVLNSSSGTRETIPGAHWMPGAGDGRFFNAEKSRLSKALEKVTGGDKNRPLVFLCISSQCWESYNACLHALEAGYKDVTWYRGGTNSWKAARQEMKAPEKFNW